MNQTIIKNKANRISQGITFIVLSLSSAYLMASEEKGHNKLSSYPSAVSQSTINKNLTVKTDTNLSITRRSETKKARPARNSKEVQLANRKIRDKQPPKSLKEFGFEFYSANSYFNVDLDGDGYFSDFTVEFDADYEEGFADVYAVIYYSQNGGDWIELTVTDVFTIYLNDEEDYYSLDISLNNGFPTSDYDLLIDLYEDGVSGIVATISSDDTDELFALPLEDQEHEFAANNVQIPFVASDLFGDFDGDLFYTDLTLEYDIDSQYTGDIVYAEIVLFNINARWEDIRRTEDFVLENQTEFIDLGFNAGYTPGFYDVEINLINAFTGEVIANAAQEFSSLRSLPIESTSYDSVFDDLSPDVDVRVSSGSFGWSVLLLGLFGLRRRTVSALKSSASL